MSEDIKVKDMVDAILNPSTKSYRPEEQENMVWGEFNFKHKATDFELKQEVLPEGSAIVEERLKEISIVDLKGNHFKFPGNFIMTREGNKVSFKAIP